MATASDDGPKSDNETIEPGADNAAQADADAEAAVAYWEATMSVSAIYANHVAVFGHLNSIRLTFGEQLTSNAPIWMRTAVVLSDVQAFDLWRQLDAHPAVQSLRNIVGDVDENAV